MKEESAPTAVQRRAILIFADRSDADLARRGLPTAARSLLQLPVLSDGFGVAADVHLFTRGAFRRPHVAQVHRQSGRDFRERFENAIETLYALGYGEIVAIGRDCPALRIEDIAGAFEQLEEKRLVLGPDHRGGCYLIGIRASEGHLVRGVRWERNTDCEQLRDRCAPADVALLAVKQDVDSWAT
jgi:glycosyltransferase A (GT-A) superfamily protein (DUF2064 family)